jgi:hypothetical protein
MTEQERGPIPLKAIHIVLEAVDGRLTKLSFTPNGSFDFVSQITAFSGASIAERSVERLTAEAEATETAEPREVSAGQATPTKERSPTTVIPGEFNTQPAEGRPDRHGKPTAWAQLLAHVEDREGATLLSTSFHGRTREIALGLNKGDHITAQGYLHLRPEDPVNPRLSTFSVIHLLNYPGKAPRERS